MIVMLSVLSRLMGAFPCGGESREFGQDFSSILFQRQNFCINLSPAFQAGCALRACFIICNPVGRMALVL